MQVPDPEKVTFLTQTTLSLDETRGIIEILKRRFPRIAGPKSQDICYATENRQLAVKAVAPLCQLLLVVGSQNSSNSKRLVEVCKKSNVPAHLLDDCSFLEDGWFDGVDTVSVTAGASAPEHLVRELIEALQGRGYSNLEELDIVDEDVRFHLPQELQSGIVHRGLNSSSHMTPGLQVADALVGDVSRATLNASTRLLGLQRADGFWWGDLTADSTLESDWLLLLLWLYPPQAGVWNPPDRDRVNRAAQSILGRQLPDGGFSIYPSGPSDVSASVKAYFALKLSGEPLDSEPMTRLRERILALGGIRAANSYVKINLSLFNLYPRDRVPTVPPEIVLLGKLL